MKPTRKQLNKAKRDGIFKAAMTLLIQGGGEKLSMRKIAEEAGVSLGNLQYHYKTKEDLLTALLNGFLEQYLDENWGGEMSSNVSCHGELAQLFLDILTHDSFEECSIVFKELWALSQRNEEIEKAILSYYKKIHLFLCNLLKEEIPQADDHKIIRVVDILVPFFEGYCITNKALRSDPVLLAKDLARITEDALKEDV